MSATISYLDNSGFVIRLLSLQLIIDFCSPMLDPKRPDGALVERALKSGMPTLAIATHAHGDHFQRVVVDWAEKGFCQLVLGADIERGYPAAYLAEGNKLTLSGARIQAFGSTDQGISVLIQVDGLSIFHAGDLNNWHWRAESDLEEVRQMQRAFDRILDTLPKDRIDIALFPVDPRMGDGYDLGAQQFIERTRPRYFIPMHFREARWAARRFCERAFPGTELIALTEPGQAVTLPRD